MWMINRSGRLGDGRAEWDFLNKTANKAAERIEARGLWVSSQLSSEVFLREGKRNDQYLFLLFETWAVQQRGAQNWGLL